MKDLEGSNSELLSLLDELARLADNHGYIWHAEYIRKTIAAFGKSAKDGWSHLASIQFWGGPGSICDTNYFADEIKWHRSNNRSVPEYLRTLSKDDYATDNTRQMELLSSISKLIPDDYGKSESLARWFLRARRMGEIYDTWLADPKNAKPTRL